MKRLVFLLWQLMALLLSACGNIGDTPDSQQPDADAVATLVAQQLAETSTAEAATPTEVTMDPHPLAGMLYRDDDGIWIIGLEGQPEFIAERDSFAVLSPDQSQYLYTQSPNEDEDIWLMNRVTGETRQLTDTPDTLERGYQWWPARPNVVVFNYMLREELGPWAGYLESVNLVTGVYLNLDGETGSNSDFALSPDGETIAYDSGAGVMLYKWGVGSTAIEFKEYGVGFGNSVNVQTPAWSPDGKQLAMMVAGDLLNDGRSMGGVLILDLEAKTSKLLHTFEILGGGGWTMTVSWSPAGEWLAVVTHAEISGERASLWALRADGGEEQHLGFADSPIWSPDGTRLVYILWPPPGTGEGSYKDAKVMSVEVGVWQPTQLDLPPGSFVEAWFLMP